MADEPKIPLEDDTATLEGMQKDLQSLLLAWADRGIAPSDAAIFMAGQITAVLMALDVMSLGEFITLTVNAWEEYDGRM